MQQSSDCIRNWKDDKCIDINEAGRVDFIKIIGPSGEEEESYKIVSENNVHCSADTPSDDSDIVERTGITVRKDEIKEVMDMKEKIEIGRTCKGNISEVQKRDDTDIVGNFFCNNDRYCKNAMRFSETLAAVVVRMSILDAIKCQIGKEKHQKVFRGLKAGNEDERKIESNHCLLAKNAKIHDFLEEYIAKILQQSYMEIIRRIENQKF